MSTARARLAAALKRAARSRPIARRFRIGELDDVGARDADAVLAVLLGPVERVVGKADQLVPLAAVVGERGDAGADRERVDLADVERGDATDDRMRGGDRRRLVVPRQQDGELVAAEPEGLAALAQPAGDLRRTRSPVGWPKWSLIVLKSSTSMKQSVSGTSFSCAIDSSRCSRSWKCRWFPSPVSGSVRASRIAVSARCCDRW